MCDRGEHPESCTCGTDGAPAKPRRTLFRQADEDVRDAQASCHALDSFVLPCLEDERFLSGILANANRPKAFAVDTALRDGHISARDFETANICVVRQDGAWAEESAFGTCASVRVSSNRVERLAAASEDPFGDTRWN